MNDPSQQDTTTVNPDAVSRRAAQVMGASMANLAHEYAVVVEAVEALQDQLARVTAQRDELTAQLERSRVTIETLQAAADQRDPSPPDSGTPETSAAAG